MRNFTRDVYVDKSGGAQLQTTWRSTKTAAKSQPAPINRPIAIHTAIGAAWSQGRPQQRSTASAAPSSRKLHHLHDFSMICARCHDLLPIAKAVLPSRFPMICGTLPRSAPHRASCFTFMICGTLPRSAPHRASCITFMICGTLPRSAPSSTPHPQLRTSLVVVIAQTFIIVVKWRV